MRRLLIATGLSLTTLLASAMTISTEFTTSTLTVSSRVDGWPAAITTDPTGFSVEQWTDPAHWRLNLSVYDGAETASLSHSMSGMLAPYTVLEWDAVLDVTWTGGVGPDGLPEEGWWTYSACGSPLVGSCRDTIFYLGGSSGHYTEAIHLLLTNEQPAPDQFTPFELRADMAMGARSTVPAPVPEPASAALTLAGLMALGATALRRQRRR